MLGYVFISLFIGLIVNIYYFTKHGEEYRERLKTGKSTIDEYRRGFYLTLLLWPVTIYNQEFRRK